MSKNQNKNKLPCITWVATGNCPYGNKCQYIHIDELKCRGKEIKTKDTNNFSKKIDEQSLIFYPFSESSNQNKYVSPYETSKIKRLDVFTSMPIHNKENLNNNSEINPINLKKEKKSHHVPDYRNDNVGPALLDGLINFIQQ